MCIIISRVNVDWPHAFQGYLPSKYIFKSNGLYTCELYSTLKFHVLTFIFVAVGILGATVMPHSLFLGSALATQDRVSFTDPGVKADFSRTSSISQGIISIPERRGPSTTISGIYWSSIRILKNTSEYIMSRLRSPPPKNHSTRTQTQSLGFIKAHLLHGTVDVVTSLLGFAVVINSLYVFFPQSLYRFPIHIIS